MTTHIDKFLERVQGNKTKGSQTFVMTMNDACGLEQDIRYIIEKLISAEQQLKDQPDQSVLEVKISGGSF